MVVSEKLSYTFVSTMKCATNTMYELLTKHFYGKRVGDYHCRDPRFIDPVTPLDLSITPLVEANLKDGI